jgi:hypothetical protein
VAVVWREYSITSLLERSLLFSDPLSLLLILLMLVNDVAGGYELETSEKNHLED